jgi:hypothetical protein
MKTFAVSKIIRITVGANKDCPDGEREQYQLEHGFYTTSKKIHKTVWDGEPTHAVVYYSKNFPDKWCAGAFKGIYEVGNKIDITTQEQWDERYPEDWWPRDSSHADLYRSHKWSWEHWAATGGKERGFELTLITDEIVPLVYKGYMGPPSLINQDEPRNTVRRIVDRVRTEDEQRLRQFLADVAAQREVIANRYERTAISASLGRG